jgi:uncharacterized protein YdaT
MAKRNVHVTKNPGGGWKVSKEAGKRASAITETQKEAIERARSIAQREQSEVVVHGVDGKIREKTSHGNDPHPPKG